MLSTALHTHRRLRVSGARAVLRPGSAELVCALFFVSGLGQTALVPLLPRLSAADGLSAAATALVLALPGLAMLLVSVPVGLLADRFGARRVTLASGALLVLGCGGQALSPLPALLVGRVVYGLSFGALWTAGAAWLSEPEPSEVPAAPGGPAAPVPVEDRGSRVGRAVVWASVGTMIGPALGGLLGSGASTALPFGTIAIAAAVVSGLLLARGRRRVARRGEGSGPPRSERRPTGLGRRALARRGGGFGPPRSRKRPAGLGRRALARRGEGVEPPRSIPRPTNAGGAAATVRGGVREALALLRDPRVAAGIGSLVVAGATSGATQLLIARGLRAGGVSAGEIGLVFSACAVGYISVSAVFVRLGARGHTLRVNAIVALLASIALLPALASRAPGVLVAALLLTAAPRGAINVVAYGVAGRADRGGGSVFGLLNGAWAAATVSAPLAAGALAALGGGAAYLVVIVPCLAISAALLLGAARRAPEDGASADRGRARTPRRVASRAGLRRAASAVRRRG